MRAWSFALILSAAVLAACPGGSHDAGGRQDAGTTAGAGAGTDGGTTQTCTVTAVPWLKAGNFWMVSWSEVDIQVGLFKTTGNYDLGSYVMKLDAPRTVGDLTMYGLQLSGDTRKYTPLWDSVGTDGCGNIYASLGTGQPVRIHLLSGTTWTGRGFWTSFSGYSNIQVNRNASIVPSQYTKKLDIFEPPLTSVGYSDSQSGIGAGTGCDYFPGYGTICGSDDPGGSRRTMYFEYWDEAAGPVAMHYGYNYNSGGSLSTQQHKEQRIEVWYFGDTSSIPMAFQNEPDSYAKSTPLVVPEGSQFLMMLGEVNSFDHPSGTLAGYTPATYATEVHDWYSFEVKPAQAGKEIDFILAWSDEVDFGFYLYTAPDNPTYGFRYLAAGKVTSAWTETKHNRFHAGTFVAGKYLLGVKRVTQTDYPTEYAIFMIPEQ